MDRKFCVFCWRAVSSTGKRKGRTRYFCNYHKASKDNKKNHDRQRRLLMSSFESKGVMLSSKSTKDEYYDALSDCVLKLTIHPSITLGKYPYPPIGLLKQSNVILNAVEWAYPITYKILKHLRSEAPTTKISFAEGVVRSLVDDEEQKELPVSCVNLKIDKDALVWIPLMIEMLARHEAFMIVSEKKLRTGPPIGTLKDHVLRDELARLVSYYRGKGIKQTQKDLASQLGKSVQRISVLMKELELTTKV